MSHAVDSSLLVVSAPGDGVGPCALLGAGPRSPQLLVNVPEGFARLVLEHRVRPTAKLAAVVLTHLGPSAAAGLPALLLRLAADGHGRVEVIGPPGTAAFVAAASAFVKWVHPQVCVTELVPGDVSVCHLDDHVAVAPLWSSGADEAGHQCSLCALCTAFPPHMSDASNVRTLSTRDDGANACKKRRLEDGMSNDSSSSSSSFEGDDHDGQEFAGYATTPVPARGAGTVPVQLPRTLGKSVSMDGRAQCTCCLPKEAAATASRVDGTNPVFIRSSALKTAGGGACPQHAAPVACADRQSLAAPVLLGYLCLLRARRECFMVLDEPGHMPLAAAHATCNAAHSLPISLTCLFTGSPHGVPHTLTSAHMLHCVGKPTAFGHLASAAVLVRLNAASPDLFPLPWALQQPQQSCANDTEERSSTLLMRAVFSSQAPAGRAPLVDLSMVPPQLAAAEIAAVRDALQAQLPPISDVEAPPPVKRHAGASNAAAANALRARLASSGNAASDAPSMPALLPSSATVQAAAPEVLFLGTGCAEPSKFRGASSILVTIPGRGCILLDCGEGCVGAVTRALGPDAAAQVWASLVAVCITHHHADHMLGLPGVLAAAGNARRQTRSGWNIPPPLVVGPPNAAAWLAGLPPHAWGGSADTMLPPFLPLACLRANAGVLPAAIAPYVAAAFGHAGVARLLTVPVDHCPDAHALILWHTTGWSIAFSGDGRPCPAFAAAACGCTLLIQEATFTDDLQAHATAKRHCTTAEALRVASQAQARHTVLTHFSQRHPKQAIIQDESLAPTTSVAFDGMRLRLDRLTADAAAIASRIAVALAKDSDGVADELEL